MNERAGESATRKEERNDSGIHSGLNRRGCRDSGGHVCDGAESLKELK